MMGFLDGLIEGAKDVAPGLAGAAANFVLPGSGNFVNSIVKKVAGVPEDGPVEEAARIVKQDPNLYAKYLSEMKKAEVTFRELDSKDLTTVNQTMRAEAKSEHWPQYSWRPFNGFLFGITMFGVYFILPLVPSATAPQIDYTTWCAWAAVLGVATWDRGKEKRAAAGDRTMGRVSGMIGKVFNKGD